MEEHYEKDIKQYCRVVFYYLTSFNRMWKTKSGNC
jgi:hypothetical protein